MINERYLRGEAKLREVNGNGGAGITQALADIAPDFAKYVIEFPFGDIYSRDGLDVKFRQIATIAALTALGTAERQLGAHIENALHVGCTKEQIIETIIQMSVYAGFPAALNGLAVARPILKSHGLLDDLEAAQ